MHTNADANTTESIWPRFVRLIYGRFESGLNKHFRFFVLLAFFVVCVCQCGLFVNKTSDDFVATEVEIDGEICLGLQISAWNALTKPKVANGKHIPRTHTQFI